MSTHSMPHPERRQHDRRRNANTSSAAHSGMDTHTGSYARFAAMIGASAVVGFGATYLSSFELDHVYFSWSRVFMAMIMAATMAAVMMLFMWKMYKNPRANLAVLGAAAALFIAGVGLLRTQATISDVAWMKAMIPHHSIAILTSERASITDPRVRRLADGIIESQQREIAEMKALIAEMDDR